MWDHKRKVAKVFDKVASDYGQKGCSFFDHFGEKLVRHAGVTQGARVLDVATGKGAVLFPAAIAVGSNGSVIGIDLSTQMLAEVRKSQRWQDNIELLHMDAEDLVFPDAFFDFVFCACALPFFENISMALSEFKRVVKPGGKIALSTFYRRPQRHMWVIERAKQLGAGHHIGSYDLDSPAVLQQALEDAGYACLDLQEEEYVTYHATAKDWWQGLFTHSVRSYLDQLSPENLAILESEALARAETELVDGKVVEDRSVMCVIATV